MKILDVEATPLSLPLREPLRMAVATVTARDSVFVRIRTDDGVEGTGDAVVAPYFSGETLGSALAVVRGIAAPLLAGETVDDIERLSALLSRAVVGNSAARAAVDLALWDAKARRLGLPLHDLLGGSMRDEVPVTWHLARAGSEANAEDARAALAAGFRLFKLKVGTAPLRDDLATAFAVREAIGPDAALALDVNQAWSPSEAVRFLRDAEELDLAFVEQPVHRADIRGLAWVQARTATVVAADEAVFDARDLLEHVRCDAVHGVVAKLIKTAGAGGLLRLAAIAESAGIGVHVAGMAGETSVSAAAGLHVAVALRSLPLGSGLAPHYLLHDIVEEPLRPQRGTLRPPAGPGHGVTVSEEALRRFAIDH